MKFKVSAAVPFPLVEDCGTGVVIYYGDDYHLTTAPTGPVVVSCSPPGVGGRVRPQEWGE